MKTPSSFDVRDEFRLMGSAWQNTETEVIARNIVLLQQHMDPKRWTPFSWEQYVQYCQHRVSEAERGVLEALTHGGRPVWNTSAHLQPGYLAKGADDCYRVTPKFIEVISRCLSS